MAAPQARREKLMALAREILEGMDDHQLFGFVLSHVGKRAVPQIVKVWTDVSAEKTAEPRENLVQLVPETQKPRADD